MNKRNRLGLIKLPIKKNYSNVYIFGENHSKRNDIERIRTQVLNLKPDIIIHELLYNDNYAEFKFYKQHLPDAKLFNLEDNLNTSIFDLSLPSQFRHREENMINNIDYFYDPFKKICVVIGDTHLRKIKTPELGDASRIPIVFNTAKIIRSDYKEII